MCQTRLKVHRRLAKLGWLPVTQNLGPETALAQLKKWDKWWKLWGEVRPEGIRCQKVRFETAGPCIADLWAPAEWARFQSWMPI